MVARNTGAWPGELLLEAEPWSPDLPQGWGGVGVGDLHGSEAVSSEYMPTSSPEPFNVLLGSWNYLSLAGPL